MARGRFISKEISLDMKVELLSDDTARLLFTWLIPHLDVEGRMYGEPHLVKAQVFPRRTVSVARVDKYLNEMVKLGLIFRYSNGHERFIFKPNFEKHQIGLRKDKEAPSVIPPPSSNMEPPTVPTNDGLESGKVKISLSKENIKLKLSKEDVEKIRGEFPDLENFDTHIENFKDYWSQQKKPYKIATKALRNWMLKEKPTGNTTRTGRFVSSKLGKIPTEEELD